MKDRKDRHESERNLVKQDADYPLESLTQPVTGAVRKRRSERVGVANSKIMGRVAILRKGFLVWLLNSESISLPIWQVVDCGYPAK